MEPSIEICAARNLAPEQQEEVDEWFQLEFGHIPYQWTPPDWRVLARVEDTLIGHLAIIERRVVSVDGQPIPIAGIGGVMTRLAWRGRGIASAMLEQTVAFIKNELAAEFCLLLCREEVAPLYARFGWKRVEGPTTFQQPVGKMIYPRLTMILSCRGREWPIGPIDLCGLPW